QVAAYYKNKSADVSYNVQDIQASQPLVESPLPFVSSLGNFLADNPVNPVYVPPDPVPTQDPYQDDRQYDISYRYTAPTPAPTVADYQQNVGTGQQEF
ncbi:unnamed protein product, partial [marine sediment metagenome]